MGTLESKQQPMLKHVSGVMPGKPQFFLFSAAILEHRQGAVERALSTCPLACPLPALGGALRPLLGSCGHTGKWRRLISPGFELCNVLRDKQGFAEVIS